MGLAIVTGGSRGIGAAIAEKLAQDGHDVLINCASSVEKAEAVAEKSSGMLQTMTPAPLHSKRSRPRSACRISSSIMQALRATV